MDAQRSEDEEEKKERLEGKFAKTDASGLYLSTGDHSTLL